MLSFFPKPIKEIFFVFLVIVLDSAWLWWRSKDTLIWEKGSCCSYCRWKNGTLCLCFMLIRLDEKLSLLEHRVIVWVKMEFLCRCVFIVVGYHAFHLNHVHESQHLAWNALKHWFRSDCSEGEVRYIGNSTRLGSTRLGSTRLLDSVFNHLGLKRLADGGDELGSLVWVTVK